MSEQRPPGASSAVPQIRPIGAAAAPPSIRPPAQPAKPKIPGAPSDNDLASMELIDTPATPGPSKIRKMGDFQHLHTEFHRPTNITHTGATRVKTFIGKMSAQGMDYMDHVINEWLDKHPDVEVKFVTTTYGQLDGKVERAMVTSVWY
jgi:hypothetical protein